MKALVACSDAPAQLQLEENHRLPTPGAGQVLIEVKACVVDVVDPSSAWRQWVGGGHAPSQRELSIASDRSQLSVPGYFVSGVVARAAEDVAGFVAGEEVVAAIAVDAHCGGYADYCLAYAWDVAKKPANVTHVNVAASLAGGVFGYLALHYAAHMVAGDTVLVLDAAGTEGHIAVQLASLWGAKVLAAVRTDREEAYLRSLGEHAHIARIVQLPASNLVAAVAEETGGLGCDVVVVPPALGHAGQATLGALAACVGLGGRVVVSAAEPVDRGAAQLLQLKCAGVHYVSPHMWTLSSAQQGRFLHMLTDLLANVSRGKVKPKAGRFLTSLREVLDFVHEARGGKAAVDPERRTVLGAPVLSL